jgi:hypothetical protein
VRLIAASNRRKVLKAIPAWLHPWFYRAMRLVYRRRPVGARVTARVSAFRLRLRHRSLSTLPGVTVMATGRRSWLCRELDRFSVEDVRQRQLDLVTGYLDGLAVDYFLVNTGSPLRYRVGVPAARRARVLENLAEKLGTQPVYVSYRLGLGRRHRVVLAADLRVNDVRSPASIRLAQFFVSPHGQFVLGMDHGCQVEFWEEGADGALHAPRPNRVSSVLTPEQQQPATLVVRNRPYRTVEGFQLPRLGQVHFPIDAVYTWVDGDDPAWRAKKSLTLQRQGRAPLNDLAANSARFLSRDELRYSLRSLFMYADWIRTIYLVTDDQTPSWLDLSDPRLRLVSHREIFENAGRLPTFNSHAIESRLHHITGLSEQFLYLNDDVFFGRPVARELFFHGNGLSKFFLSHMQLELGDASSLDSPVMSAAKNNRRLIDDAFGRTVTQKYMHVAHSLQRGVLYEMEERFAEEFARTADSQFRSHNDLSIASALHHDYTYATGRAAPGELSYGYTDSSDPLTPLRLQHMLRHRDRDVFCLNDTDLGSVDLELHTKLTLEFLESYFPVPSPFERGAGRDVGSSGTSITGNGAAPTLVQPPGGTRGPGTSRR